MKTLVKIAACALMPLAVAAQERPTGRSEINLRINNYPGAVLMRSDVRDGCPEGLRAWVFYQALGLREACYLERDGKIYLVDSDGDTFVVPAPESM